LDISKKKFGSAYALSPWKCSKIKILAKIDEKEAKFFSKIYEGFDLGQKNIQNYKTILCLCTFKVICLVFRAYVSLQASGMVGFVKKKFFPDQLDL
jgi:hypothetical protein